MTQNAYIKKASEEDDKRKEQIMDKEALREYYQNCPIPKPPKKKKKRKKQNGWKDKPNRCCYYTGQPYAERHELFYGNPNRQISIDHGFQVDLCPPIHQLFHGQVDKAKLQALQIPGMFPDPLAWAEDELDRLRKECQHNWEVSQEIELGRTSEEARADWVDLIGRSYILDD